MLPRSAEAEMLSRMRRDAESVMVAPGVSVTAKPTPVVTAPPMPTKVCAYCGKPKAFPNFRPCPKNPGGLSSLCKTCSTKLRRQRKAERESLG
jgi:hypothetical protein